jgi:uncharacterized membrane protein
MNENTLKKISKNLLGGTLVFAGISHLTFARRAFRAQVPDWVPLGKDDTVVYSGIAKIALGSSLVLANEEHRESVGKIAGEIPTVRYGLNHGIGRACPVCLG